MGAAKGAVNGSEVVTKKPQRDLTLTPPTATLESLGLARDFAGEQAARAGLDPDLSGRLDLVLKELLINVGSYAYPEGGGDLEVDCVLEADQFCLVLRDWGVAFDPLATDAPDLDAGLDDREPGGQGIFLVRELADHCAYRRVGDANEFRACFSRT